MDVWFGEWQKFYTSILYGLYYFWEAIGEIKLNYSDSSPNASIPKFSVRNFAKSARSNTSLIYISENKLEIGQFPRFFPFVQISLNSHLFVFPPQFYCAVLYHFWLQLVYFGTAVIIHNFPYKNHKTNIQGKGNQPLFFNPWHIFWSILTERYLVQYFTCYFSFGFLFFTILTQRIHSNHNFNAFTINYTQIFPNQLSFSTAKILFQIAFFFITSYTFHTLNQLFHQFFHKIQNCPAVCIFLPKTSTEISLLWQMIDLSLYVGNDQYKDVSNQWNVSSA